MQQALVEKRLLHLKMVQEEVTKPAKQLKVSIPIFEQIQEIHQEQSILLLLDRITTQAEITHLRDKAAVGAKEPAEKRKKARSINQQ